MKRTMFILSIVLLTASAIAIQGPSISKDSISLEPKNPVVGDQIEIAATTTSNTSIMFFSADIPGDNQDWITKNCETLQECTKSWSFTADNAGEKEVRFRAQDGEMRYSNIVTKTFTVEETVEENQPPNPPELSADFGWTPVNPKVGEQVTFEATDVQGDVESFDWSINGNDVGGDNSQIDYTFENANNNHQVQLTVTGSEDSYSVTKNVDVDRRPVTCDLHSGLQIGDSMIDRGENSSATVTLSNDGDNQTVDVRIVEKEVWGSTGHAILDRENVQIDNGEQREFSASTTNLERDTLLQMVVEKKGSCSGRDVATREVVVLQPQQEPVTDFEADFTWSQDPTAGENVTFSSTSSPGPNGIQNYTWHIEGSAPQSGSTVQHSFEEPGTHQVQLVIEGPQGAEDAVTQSVEVERRPISCQLNVGNIELDPSTIENGESSEASVTVTNDGNTDRRFTIRWMKDYNYISQQTVTMDSRSRTFTQSYSPNRDTAIRAVIETEDNICGHKEDVKYNELTVLQTNDPEIINEGDGEAELTVNVENQDGDKLDAQVSMDNGESYTGFTGSDGEKTFTVKPGDYEVTASKHDYTTETREISLEDGEEKNVTITLEQLEDSNTANLEVIVENENGERLEDASVAVENGDSKTDSTDSDGESRFSLEPGDYTISVSKPGYSSKDKTIELEEGDSETEVFTLGEQGEKAIEIQSISYPDTVCRGQSFTADVTVKNQGGFHEMVTLTGTGLGSINIGERFSLDQNAEKTSELVFTDVQGSGTEEFEVTATNHDTDKETRTINVKSCVTTTPQKEQARGITMSVEPQEVVVGNSVHVKGYVNGIKGSANVEIRLNGERKARVATQPDGFYEVYLKPGEVGDATISATTKGASASRTIKVVPTATVDSVEAPRKVFEGKKFEVCTSVYSQVTPKVYLIRNNKVLKTKNQTGDVCFQTKAYETGTQKFTVKALAGGRGSSAYTTVEVLPMRSEVSSFSDQVASVESEEGLIKVELYNTHDKLRRYHLSLEGLPSTWQGQSQKEAVLNTGESETVYFYLTPQEAGDRDPVVKVETDGNTIYRQKIDLVTGGIKEPREQGFLSSLADLLPF